MNIYSNKLLIYHTLLWSKTSCFLDSLNYCAKYIQYIIFSVVMTLLESVWKHVMEFKYVCFR